MVADSAGLRCGPQAYSEGSLLYLPMPKDLGVPQGGVDPWGGG